MFPLIMALSLLIAQPNEYSVEYWRFESQFSYGDDEEELLQTGSQVIMVDQNYYILDASLSTVIKVSSDGSWQEISVKGEGPGECYFPNSLVKGPNGFVLLKTLPPVLVYTDLTKTTQAPDQRMIENGIFARNLYYPNQGEEFLVNIISAQENRYFYTLSLINQTGEISITLLQTERMPEEDFPVWFYRNSWAVNDGKIAVINDYDYSVTVYNLNGAVIENIHGPKNNSQNRSYTGSVLQGVFYAGQTLLILPFGSDDLLEFHAPEEKKIIRLEGVKASSQAQYFWLDKDHLAVMYGWADKVFHTGREEEHLVTFFRRKRP